MEQPRIRIVDIAQALGLSTATVSNVIHGKTEKLSDETVKRVQQELDAILAHFPPVSGELTDEEQWNAALAMTSALPQRLFTADYERMVEGEEEKHP